MSPEQARGRPVGVQADIWAFGCVLYEMLTGHSPFKGPTVTDVLAAIVRGEPDWAALPTDTPPMLRSLLRRCLQKDPSRRLQHIGDARIELDEVTLDAPAHPASRRSNRTLWLMALLLGGVAMALAVALALTWREGSEPRELRVDVATPESTDSTSIALSPDGLKLAYVASVPGGAARLHVRSLVDGSVKSYERTDFPSDPFWSPEGQSVGFFADGKLMRIDLATGLTQVLASAPLGAGGSWNRDDIILYAPTIISGLYKVAASGGAPAEVTNRSKQQTGHWTPRFLPDGQRFIYYVNGDFSVRGTYLGSLDGSAPPKRLIDAADATLIGSDFVVFQRQGTLFAQRLLADRGELAGMPVAVAGGVAFDIGNESAAVAASPNRSIAYRNGGGGGQRALVWFDRAGRELETLASPDPAFHNPQLSPDGRFVAVNRLNEAADVWLVDAHGARRRFTFDPGTDQIPVWADDHRIIFSSNRAGTYDLYEKPADRPGAEQLLLASSENKFPMDVSSDGRYLLYRNTGPNTNWDLWALPLVGEKKPFLAINSPFQEMIGEFSPDGHWLAYQTNESGQFEVFVQSFPEATTRTMISANGGSQPRWRGDGKELFFVALDNRLMAAPIAVNANRMLEPGPPVALFRTRMPGGAVPSPQKQQYAVSPDGQRFLVNTMVGDTASASVSLILNWHPPTTK
jgi:Tol biopolymer transport system component